MSFEGGILVDRQALAKAQAELGAGFVRILGYFREDGIKSLGALEDAVRKDNATAMVIPAHTLKGEARQFGADPLATLAEKIENFARQCVEHHESPRDAIADAKVTVVEGPLKAGWAEGAPYDVIVIDGAIRSGQRAAREVCDALGL